MANLLYGWVGVDGRGWEQVEDSLEAPSLRLTDIQTKKMRKKHKSSPLIFTSLCVS